MEYPSRVKVQMSPSSKYTTVFVYSMMAAASEERKNSSPFLPTPRIIGEPCLAPTSVSGDWLSMKTTPKVPVTWHRASPTASSSVNDVWDDFRTSWTRWTSASVSVSETNL